MTLEDQLRFVQSEAWRTRVGLVAARVALQVSAEAGSVTNHAARVALAVKVLTASDPKVWGYPFTVAVAARPGAQALPATPTDPQLAAAVVAVWDAMAGVGAA